MIETCLKTVAYVILRVLCVFEVSLLMVRFGAEP